MTARAVPVPAVFEDDSLPHQIRLSFLGVPDGWIAVSCSCLKQGDGSYEPLESRVRWVVAEVQAVWRAHVQVATS